MHVLVVLRGVMMYVVFIDALTISPAHGQIEHTQMSDGYNDTMKTNTNTDLFQIVSL